MLFVNLLVMLMRLLTINDSLHKDSFPAQKLMKFQSTFYKTEPKILKVSAIPKTLALSSNFHRHPDISSFTKIPSPPNPASFADHHSSYLRPEVPTKRASWLFHVTFCMQHT